MPSKLRDKVEGQLGPQLWGRREVTVRGAVRESLGARRYVARKDVLTARACSRVPMVGPRGPQCGPKPTAGPCAIPLKLLSCSLFSPHFSSNCVSLGMGQFSLPGTPAPH